MSRTAPRIQVFHVVLLLVLLTTVYASFEVFFYLWSVRHNQTRVLLMKEYGRTLSLKPQDTSSGRPTLLLAGNSCLEYAVDVDRLQNTLSDLYKIQRLMVLATTYEDWYYGLQEIFRRGSRPQYVVLMLSPMQFSLDYPIPELSTVYLYRPGDLWHLASDRKMNLTETAMLYITHYSPFWGSREAMRYWKKRALPGYEAAMQVQTKGLSQPRDMQVDPKRLHDLQWLCARYGSEFMLVIPPTGQPADTAGAAQLAALASGTGVSVLRPLPNENIDSSYYQVDGFHLNTKGSQLFTALLARSLREPIHTAFADASTNGKLRTESIP